MSRVAGVAKLVNAADLKSAGPKDFAGSSPAARTIIPDHE
tara:strand:- start:12415 stop:12534 length:120 start_codon:yes stop_codon:yes gene_type:complete